MSGFGYDVLGFGSGAGVAGPEVDEDFNRTSFLSHFDGANNGVNEVFDDGSASNHTITKNGNVTQGSFGPFARPEGYWGAYFTGTAGDYINYASSADWSVGTGDFTVEFWINPREWSQPYMPVFVVDNNSGLFIGLSSTSGTAKFVLQPFGSSNILEYDLPAVNTWTHILVSRSGTSCKLFYNGIAVATATSSQNFGQSDLNIGSYTSFARYLSATLSNLHYVKGTATQTSNFTPPTGPSTAVSGTKLLTLQNNRFVDKSASPHASTIGGNVAISAFGPFLTDAAYDPAVNGASASFTLYSGLTVADSPDFTLGNTFTLEAWIYPNSSLSATFNCVQAQFPNGYHWAELDGIEMEFYKYYDGVRHTSGTVSPMLNQWTHVAYVCDGGTAYHYINGARSGSSASMSVADISTLIHIGILSSGTDKFPGFISDYRMVVGTAVYSGTTYTIPTAPLTAITNTKLLLNMANAQAIDSTAQNILTLYGNAKLSTGQAKFGDTSLYFNGVDDIARIIDTSERGIGNFRFGTGDFTVEFWYYGTTVVDAPLLDMRERTITDNNQARVAIFFTNNSGNVGYFATGSTRITSNITVATNTWTHIALVRSSSVTRFYFNGTQDNQTYSDTINLLNSQLTIGLKYNSSSNNNVGYYDEIRISNMARYTSSFTAPTKPFPDQGQLE